jgi:hypothetical protein
MKLYHYRRKGRAVVGAFLQLRRLLGTLYSNVEYWIIARTFYEAWQKRKAWKIGKKPEENFCIYAFGDTGLDNLLGKIGWSLEDGFRCDIRYKSEENMVIFSAWDMMRNTVELQISLSASIFKFYERNPETRA